jgi:hypothetical protein
VQQVSIEHGARSNRNSSVYEPGEMDAEERQPGVWDGIRVRAMAG